MSRRERGTVYRGAGSDPGAGLRRRYALAGYFAGVLTVMVLSCHEKVGYWLWGP